MSMILSQSKLVSIFKFLIFCLFLPIQIWANTTQLEIQVSKSFVGTFKLFSLSNPLLNAEKLVANAERRADDIFVFQLPIQETSHFYIDNDFTAKEIYLEPGKQYFLIYDAVKKQIEWKNQEKDDLNVWIEKLNSDCNSFFTKYFGTFAGRIPSADARNFIAKLNDDFGKQSNLYFKTCLYFKIATIEKIAGLKKTSVLANDYLNNAPFLYAHPFYLDFLNLMADGYLDVFLIGKGGNTLRQQVNGNQAYDKIYQTFLQDSTWKKEHLRHYMLLSGLKNLCYNKEFRKDNIITIFQSASKTIKNEQLSRWALEMFNAMGKFISGKPVPNATFTQMSGNKTNLLSYKGKPIYISYFPKAGNFAGQELAKLKTIYAKAKGSVVLITILGDMPAKALEGFVKRNNYEWIFGVCQTDDSFCEIYETGEQPSYYLIDAKSNTFQIPAEAPSTDVEMQFPALLRIKAEK